MAESSSKDLTSSERCRHFNKLGYGVAVALGILVPSAQVRILISQPVGQAAEIASVFRRDLPWVSDQVKKGCEKEGSSYNVEM